VLTRVGKQRGWRPPTADHLRHEIETGAWHVGSPETVARKIADSLRTLGAVRFDLKYGLAGVPHEAVMRNIEL
jgi:alkanesulfonate monooxygenase SsuD/methylene tetrahydromethanopterin reductase-like flavin-dependent oxidoreductase (luciferase family)